MRLRMIRCVLQRLLIANLRLRHAAENMQTKPFVDEPIDRVRLALQQLIERLQRGLGLIECAQGNAQIEQHSAKRRYQAQCGSIGVYGFAQMPEK